MISSKSRPRSPARPSAMPVSSASSRTCRLLLPVKAPANVEGMMSSRKSVVLSAGTGGLLRGASSQTRCKARRKALAGLQQQGAQDARHQRDDRHGLEVNDGLDADLGGLQPVLQAGDTRRTTRQKISTPINMLIRRRNPSLRGFIWEAIDGKKYPSNMPTAMASAMCTIAL
jgi:hypothetical protein